MKKKCNLGAIVHIATPKKKKTMSFNKYSKGTKDIDAIATDAGDEILKQAQASAPKNNIRGTYNNEDTSIGAPTQSAMEGRQAEDSYNAVQAGRKAESDYANSQMPSGASKLNNNVSKGADAKLAAWQKKRGLKDDGIWGAESKKAYAKEQASKKSTSGNDRPAGYYDSNRTATRVNTEGTPISANRKQPFKNTDFSAEVKNNNAYKNNTRVNSEGVPISDPRASKFKDSKYDLDLSKAPKGTAAQNQESLGDLEDTMGRRSAANKMYKNTDVRNAAYDKGYNSVERPKNLLDSTKNYSTVKGKSIKKKAEVEQPWYNMTYSTSKSKKYAEGTSGIKKMFSKKARAESEHQAALEDAKDTASTAVQQETSFVGPTNKSQASYEGEKARESYEARLAGEKARTELEGKSSTTPTVTKSTPANWNNKAEMDKVKAYQSRHGLKADGVWGDKTKAYYEQSLTKKSSTPFGSTRGTAVKSTTGTSTTPKKSEFTKRADGGSVDKEGNIYYSNGRAYQASTGKMGNWSRTGNKNSITTKNDKPVRSEEERQRAARVIEKQYQDPEMSTGGFGIPKKQAEQLVDIEDKGDEATMSTGKKLGLGALGVAALGAAAYGAHRANKSHIKGLMTPFKTTQELADDIKFGKLADKEEARILAKEVGKKKTTTKKMKLTKAIDDVAEGASGAKTVKDNKAAKTVSTSNAIDNAADPERAARAAEAIKKSGKVVKTQAKDMPNGITVDASGQHYSQSGRKMKPEEVTKVHATHNNKVVQGHGGEEVTVLEPKPRSRAKKPVETKVSEAAKPDTEVVDGTTGGRESGGSRIKGAPGKKRPPVVKKGK